MKEELALILSVLESLNEPCLLLDECNDTILGGNGKAFQLYGFAPEKLIGKKESDLRAPRQCHAPLEPEIILHQTQDKSVFPVKIQPLRCPPGIASSSLSYKLIVSQTTAANRYHPVADNGCIYQKVLESQTNFISRARNNGLLTYVNETYCDFFGKKRGELIGHNWRPLAHPDDLPSIEKQLGTLSPQNRSVTIESRVVLPGKNIRWVHVENQAFFDPAGKLVEVQSVGHDITSRKQTEAQLEASERRFHAIFDSAFQLISLLSPDGTILETNETAVSFTGLRRDQIVGQKIWDLPYPDYSEEKRRRLENSLHEAAAGKLMRFNMDVTRGDGVRVTLDISYKPVFDATGNVIHILAEGRDISLSRAQEHERLQASKLEALGVLAGGIAHDLNNIMMCISLSLELLRMQAKRGNVTEDGINDALKNVKRASELSNRLLTFAKGGDPIMSFFDLGEVVSACTGLALRGSNLESELDIEAGLPLVHGDQGLLMQVINHLIINARDACPQGGVLHVKLSRLAITSSDATHLEPGRYIRLEVRDHGCGIPPENLTRIFDPYFTTKKSGSGIGLTTCFSIIRRHKGTIQVKSTVGEGTTFTVLLPCNVEAPHVEAAALTPIPPPTRQYRILIIEDDFDLRGSLAQMLRLSGFSATEADKGETAFALYRKALRSGKPYDAVLIDATIKGGLGGSEALQLLQRADSKIRAVIMSGYTHSSVMANWQENGFVGVLRKPFTSEKVIDMLHRICATPASNAPEDS
jgi:two-component system, cell cycle sensor histidine kinase and response regulator CckA